jgi:hypothetical protein
MREAQAAARLDTDKSRRSTAIPVHGFRHLTRDTAVLKLHLSLRWDSASRLPLQHCGRHPLALCVEILHMEQAASVCEQLPCPGCMVL